MEHIDRIAERVLALDGEVELVASGPVEKIVEPDAMLTEAIRSEWQGMTEHAQLDTTVRGELRRHGDGLRGPRHLTTSGTPGFSEEHRTTLRRSARGGTETQAVSWVADTPRHE
jgi:hypothetical protein